MNVFSRIRTKLLLAVAGALLAVTGFSLYLQLEEAERMRADVRLAIDGVARELVRAVEPGGALHPEAPAPGNLRHSPLVVRMDLGPRGWVLWVERPRRSWVPLDDPLETDLRREEDVLPGPAGELEQVVREEFSDPVRAARERALPRQLLVAGSVLAVGLLVVWVLAGRVTGQLEDLTANMERVAAGDLDVRVEPKSRDEVRKMSLAFNSMVESLREKRELERSIQRTERLTAMGNLAAGVAHDIRNPLNTIGLVLDHLRDRYPPEDRARREAYLGHLADVRKELGRLDSLVGDFLSLAHPDRGELQPIDLAELARDSLRLFRKEAQSRSVEVRAALDDSARVVANPQRLHVALTNILLNGLRAMEPRGGVMTVSLETRPGPASGAGGGEEVVLRVEDTGCGIAPENLDRVLLPYFTTRPDGTGLGLPVARGAVEASGGRIEIQSRVGEGTAVDIVLPAPAAESGPPEASAADVASRGGMS